MFPGIGNLINTAAVLIGSALGLVLRRGVPKRGQEILMQALGLSTIFIGLSGTLQAMFAVDDGRLAPLETATRAQVAAILTRFSQRFMS